MLRYLAAPAPPPTGPGAEAWAEMAREFAAAPPLTVHAAQPEVLAAAWAVLRETVLVPGRVPRGQKEAIAAAVSAAHECSYCVDVHTMFAHAARHAGFAGRRADLAARVEWARACRQPGAPRLADPPFKRDEAPEIVGTAAAFTYVNRLVTVLLDESPFPMVVRFLRVPLGRLAGRFLARAVRRPLAPGTALARLPAADIPPELAWAQPRPTIAAAFARLGAATGRAAEAHVPAAALARLSEVLDGWLGEEPPFGRAWLEEATTSVADNARPAARLAVLVALAPARVTAEDVAAFAARSPGDPALVALLSWSAYQATRRATSWQRGPYGHPTEFP